MESTISAREDRILCLAELSIEADALGEAALSRDWDEARFRSFRILNQAFELRSKTVTVAARDLAEALGPAGAMPSIGFGAALALLAEAVGSMI
jgi:hypothetical protein